MQKIGILGGTFNPIHFGHLLMAQYALSEFELDKIWFIPTGRSYMKSTADIVEGSERLYMTSLAIEGNNFFELKDLEVKRDKTTYTYETLTLLTNQFPTYEFYFIVGADSLLNMDTWMKPAEIFDKCRVIVLNRGNIDKKTLITKKSELEIKYNAIIELNDFFNIEISSTIIRDRLRENKSVKYMLPDKVIEYIDERGFYRV